MAIRKTFILLLVFLILTACEKLERPVYSNEDGQFVRFSLLVTADGELVPDGELSQKASATDFFSQKTVQTLAIPVNLTSEALEEEVLVYFSYDTIGTYSDFAIEPAGVLSFIGKKLSDTIYVNYLDRWDASVENQITFTLDSVSHDSVHLGNLNDLAANTSLTVNLEELFLRYHLPVVNRIEILGDMGETVFIIVDFPDGFFPGEVDGVELIIPGAKEFDYTLEQLPYRETDTKIGYQITLDEALDDDSVTFQASFSLTDLTDYHLAGNNTFSIVKPEYIDRDVSLNTAANFYDLGDAFYRTYSETWIDYLNRDSCVWRASSAFTFPVVVEADHPNAVLADDKGTLDPSDDIYHHAFRIGFNSPNEGRTTNSFNLKGWFENEYNDEDESPGFNIPQALEFYPGNEGTSATSGIVKVIEQDLIISGKQGDGSLVSHTITISGEGEYLEISDGIFEISLDFSATNMELFGGTQTVHHKIYNTVDHEEPAPLESGCFQGIDL